MSNNRSISTPQQSEQHNQSPFDRIRQFDEQGQEYWLARQLMKLLGYSKWENFGAKEHGTVNKSGNRVVSTICRAIISCSNSGIDYSHHFTHFPSIGTQYDSYPEDWKLSRHACYLVAMCGDVTKPAIAQAQSYFAVKTRQAEITEQNQKLPQTFADALRAYADELEAKERLAIENQLLLQENEELAEAVDELFSYSSIIRVAKFNNCSEKQFSWRKLKAVSMQMSLEIKQVPCPRYVTKNLYSHDAWRIAYPDFSLPETTTIRLAS